MRFKLPIGDWSDDGHGKCDYFIVESNVHFDVIVSTYLEMDEKYKISEICSEYEEGSLTEEQSEMVKNAGLKVDEYPEARQLAQLVIHFIMMYDSSIELKIVSEDIPMLSNWASPDGKYLSLPGYGLFE